MKVLKKRYPKGSFPYQKSDGRYVNDLLLENLDFLADKIVKDMTFMGVCYSSTLEVGTGKSVLMTQIGEIWTAIINKKYKLDLKFTEENIVWRPQDLIQRSFQHKKYSLLLVDEWEDAHYWSALAKTLREYFRKCRQQNLFVIIIIPNFFQLPINYAIGRSIFAIDVKFGNDLERGQYSFYDFNAKKDLYIRGKKNQNYKCVAPTFRGYFGDGYGVDREKYLKAKREDLERWDEEKENNIRPDLIARNERIKIYGALMNNKKLINREGMTHKTMSKIFGVDKRTCDRLLHDFRERFEGKYSLNYKIQANETATDYIIKKESTPVVVEIPTTKK